jgi:hypothetical protein
MTMTVGLIGLHFVGVGVDLLSSIVVLSEKLLYAINNLEVVP